MPAPEPSTSFPALAYSEMATARPYDGQGCLCHPHRPSRSLQTGGSLRTGHQPGRVSGYDTDINEHCRVPPNGPHKEMLASQHPKANPHLLIRGLQLDGPARLLT